MTQYALPGSRSYQEQLFPNPAHLDPITKQTLKLDTCADVIAHFTASSLAEDGIEIRDGSLSVTARDGSTGFTVSFEPLPQFAEAAAQFAATHTAMLDEEHAGLALAGAAACKKTPAWNPMKGYPVNRSDGLSEWIPYVPLGMPMVNHRAVTLLHYPPIIAYRTADYLNNNTLHRWAQVLACAGVNEPSHYHAIVDVNPIAAPGSGESEYPNDFFPINLTSQFFDNDDQELTYVRAMLNLMLNPPANLSNKCTLPLLVCGSPLYDPQAPGWFRSRYKNQLPRDRNGSPTVNVLQAGFVQIDPDNPKPTPYMIANHMIAAGVIGKCTEKPDDPQNIQRFEAQDLVAATFLRLCADAARQGLVLDPDKAKKQACRRWFGNDDGSGTPNPPDNEDRLVICALAQMDLCFDVKTVKPMYSYKEALSRCQAKGGASYSPCFGCDPLTAGV